MTRRYLIRCLPLSLLGAYLAGNERNLHAAIPTLTPLAMRKRWLFVWRDMSKPKEVDRVIARFGRAQSDGYNGVVFAHNVAPEKAAELRDAAKRHGLDLIVLVMDGSRDHNYAEGIAAKDVLFVAQGGAATHQPEHPIALVNGDFEAATGDKFAGWSYQDDIGVTTFADRTVAHSGVASLRIEDVGKNDARHARLIQPLHLQPHRQYRVSFWLKTENLVPADPEVKILAPGDTTLSFQTIHAEPTQDWTHYDIVFNSREHAEANFYLGSWYGKSGTMWWDDLKIEEIALVNVLRRPGCPVTVRGENGTVYEEGRDFKPIVDPRLQPYIPYHEQTPITLTANTRITPGERLRVSYYHSIIVYQDGITRCLSEPKIFDDWRAEVTRANDLLHPAAFFMSHDELRVINQCALCQSRSMTPGELLADNVRKAAQIIRDIRPDAEIWVWSDMFDPMHNAVAGPYFAVNGTLAGSWKGLDRDVGIVNWNGGAKGKNCAFFANLGLKQILSGYYDGDESGAGIAEWVANAKNVPGIDGAMYTTWEDRYDAMDAWATKAWGKERNQA